MRDLRSQRAIRERQRDILETVMFTNAKIQNDRRSSSLRSPNEKKKTRSSPPSSKKRTQEYMDALEQEVARLRTSETRLDKITKDWRQCAVGLIGPAKATPIRKSLAGQEGPGSWIWTNSASGTRNFESLKNILWMLLDLGATMNFGAPYPLESHGVGPQLYATNLY
ncbi:MAG: hypothetical protein M1820_010427 [Bogoriella megaspora]|nr:MAG: hypothetical protein M1820_010427 [Bogoriella megaspora]